MKLTYRQIGSLLVFCLGASAIAQTNPVGTLSIVNTAIITKPVRNATVTESALTVTGTVRNTEGVTNVVLELNGTNETTAATSGTNWAAWTASVVLAPGTNTLQAHAQNANSSAEVSTPTNTAAVFYKLTAKLSATLSPPGSGSLSPNYNGIALDINRGYTMTALARSGFEFTNWTVIGTTNTSSTTKARLTFQMVTNLQLIANMADIQKPTVTIAAGVTSAANSVFTIGGRANDNVGVTEVYYQVGSGGWNLASSTNQNTNWSAIVVVPEGKTTISVYATDAASNHSKTNSVIVDNELTGFAPATLAGTKVVLATSGQPITFGFDAATFSWSSTTSFSVGTYTYTLSDSNTAQIALNTVAPPTSGSSGAPATSGVASNYLTLSFTSGTEGNYTLSGGGSGTFTLAGAPNTAPAYLNGVTLVGLNNADIGFTDIYGDGAFVFSSTSGTNSGTYVYTPYSPSGAMLVETETNGTVSYTLITFGNPNTYQTIAFQGGGSDTDSGTFSYSGQAATKGYKAPLSIAQMTAAVTMVKTNGTRKSFDLSFDAASFGQYIGTATDDAGTGIVNYIRTGTNTGLFYNTYVAPPSQVGGNNGPIPFTFTSLRTATFTNSDGHGTITFSAAPNLAPDSLVGKELIPVQPGSGVDVVTFGYGTFSERAETKTNGGTYSYSIFGPQVSQLQVVYTNGSGKVLNIDLWFSSTVAGHFWSINQTNFASVGTFSLR